MTDRQVAVREREGREGRTEERDHQERGRESQLVREREGEPTGEGVKKSGEGTESPRCLVSPVRVQPT